MKNLLTLHEAVAVVLLDLPARTATFQTIADEIERRKLFPERKGEISLSEQINCVPQFPQVNTNIGFSLQNQIC